MSMKNVGSVLKLFTSTKGTSKRDEKQKISLDQRGVHDDKFYDKGAERSVLISCIDSYELVKKQNIEMPLGYLGENILLDFNPYKLEMGTKVKIGSSVLEISQYCTICNHLAVIDESIPELLKDDRGIFAKVITEGEINVEDKVYLL